jgi:ferric-dicitrate binding protein FerR (iron transport regulator)
MVRILDTGKEKEQLLNLYLKGELSPDQLDEFLIFLGTEEGQRLLAQNMDETGLSTMGEVSMNKKQSDLIFQQISSKIKQPKNHFRLMLKIAASFLLLISIGLGTYYSKLFTAQPLAATTIQVSGDQQETVLLPDGTHVRLNGDTKLSYSSDFAVSKIRQVTLSGEAFFEVAKNPEKPFVIDAGQSEVKVLGTVFNVKTRQGNNAVVAVQEGKVSFRGKEQTEGIILVANEVGVLAKDGNVLRIDQSSQNYFSWINHFLEFNNMPISQVVEQLDAIFDVDIELASPDLKNKYFTAYMKGKSVDEVMNQLALSLELKLEKTDGKYFLK